MVYSTWYINVRIPLWHTLAYGIEYTVYGSPGLVYGRFRVGIG